MNSESIEAPGNDHIILRGKIMTEESIPVALLRIYLGNELIDQQIIKNLKSGEEREIITSVYNQSSRTNKLYLLFHKISSKPA